MDAIHDGARDPDEGVRNITALLDCFAAAGVPVARGRSPDEPAPRFRCMIDDIAVPAAEFVHGGIMPAYFADVRALSIARREPLDRRAIFDLDLTVAQPGPHLVAH